MSSAIHAAVVNNQAIPPGPAYTDFLNDTCGYSALHDLIRDSHPRLAIHTVIYDRPTCKPQEQISNYVVRWREYLLIEHEYGRFWQRTDVARTIITNLPKEHRLWVLSQYDSLMLSKGPHIDLPPAFHMKKISKTISTLIKMNPHHSSSHNQYHNHHRSSHALSASPNIADDSACITCSQSHALQSLIAINTSTIVYVSDMQRVTPPLYRIYYAPINTHPSLPVPVRSRAIPMLLLPIKPPRRLLTSTTPNNTTPTMTPMFQILPPLLCIPLAPLA